MKKYNITFDEVITYDNYYKALKSCNKDVNYKYSVQNYDIHCAEYITDTIRFVQNGGIPKVKDVNPVVIYERGKRRIITPIDIMDRITQKVLCDNVLMPSIVPHLIYDNGASMEGKGTEFARRRVEGFIEDTKRKYNIDDLYVLVFDFKSYFDSIPHSQCYRVLGEYIADERLKRLTIGIIESYKFHDVKKITDPEEKRIQIERIHNHEGIGICLGSQISQIMAVAVPNRFDHLIKDKYRMKYYERYMDDGVIISNSKTQLLELMEILSAEAEKYGLHFNKKKTRVVKMTRGFTFLKVKYGIDSDGKTTKQLVRSGIVRERRKMKSLAERIEQGKANQDDAYNNTQSWIGHSKVAKSYKTVKTMLRLYDDKFDGYKITRKYFRKHPEEGKGKRKVVRL